MTVTPDEVKSTLAAAHGALDEADDLIGNLREVITRATAQVEAARAVIEVPSDPGLG